MEGVHQIRNYGASSFWRFLIIFAKAVQTVFKLQGCDKPKYFCKSMCYFLKSVLLKSSCQLSLYSITVWSKTANYLLFLTWVYAFAMVCPTISCLWKNLVFQNPNILQNQIGTNYILIKCDISKFLFMSILATEGIF